jgi:hypothetical protein
MPQFMHIVPAAPQLAREVPPWQVPALQQPVGQLIRSHTGVTQAPFWHCWPIMQAAHITPPTPQAKREPMLGVMQKPFWQQPSQVPGPHVAVVHAPSTHC